MKKIPLSRGMFTLVDDLDFEELNRFKWFACPNKHIFYAARNGPIRGNKRVIYMHRQLLGIINSELVSDHIDGNGLNNRRNNLRSCTQAQNVRNNTKIRGNKRYKGITRRGDGRWASGIQIDNKRIHLGIFKTALAASKAYDKAAIKYHGEFAKTNAEIYA